MSKPFTLGVLLVSLTAALQASEFEAQQHKLWIPDGLQSGALRGVFIHRRLPTREVADAWMKNHGE